MCKEGNMFVEIEKNYGPTTQKIHICEEGWGETWWLAEFGGNGGVWIAVKGNPNDCETPLELAAQMAVEMYPGLETRRQERFHQRLTRLEVLSCYGHIVGPGQFQHDGQIDGEVGSAVEKGNSLGEGGVGVDH